MKKRGILWKIRKPDQEVAIAVERGCSVKTYSCAVCVFKQIKNQAIEEGAFILFKVDAPSRLVTEVAHVRMKGHIAQWTNRFAFVKATVAPQIKISRNGRLVECKFVDDPTSKIASSFISRDMNLGFKLENNQYISFDIWVNLKCRKKQGSNAPYLDLIATHIELAEGSEDDEAFAPVSEENPTPTKENPVQDWFSRRMSSPRKERKHKKKRDSRKRGNSIPTTSDQLNKRDPTTTKFKYTGPSKETVSAPPTPLQEDNLSQEELPDNYNDFCAAFKDPEPQRETHCLRCGKDQVCIHKPPRIVENVDNSPKKPIENDLDQKDLKQLQNDYDNMKQELEKYKLLLSAQQEKNPEAVKNEVREPPLRLSLASTTEQPDPESEYSKFPLGKKFEPTPPVSPSGSPRFEHESFSEADFVCGGKPSSARSDILGTRTLPKTSYVNRTPLMDCFYPPSNLDKFCMPMSDTHSITSASTHSTNYSYQDYDSVDVMHYAPFSQQGAYYRRNVNSYEERTLMNRERNSHMYHPNNPNITSLNIMEETAPSLPVGHHGGPAHYPASHHGNQPLSTMRNASLHMTNSTAYFPSDWE